MNIDQKKWDDVIKGDTIKTENNEMNLAYLTADFANQIIPEIKEKLKDQIERVEDFLSPEKGEIIQDKFPQYKGEGDLFEKLICDPAKQDYLKSETYKRS